MCVSLVDRFRREIFPHHIHTHAPLLHMCIRRPSAPHSAPDGTAGKTKKWQWHRSSIHSLLLLLLQTSYNSFTRTNTALNICVEAMSKEPLTDWKRQQIWAEILYKDMSGRVTQKSQSTQSPLCVDCLFVCVSQYTHRITTWPVLRGESHFLISH